MPVESFNRDQFERALPVHNQTRHKLWRFVGFELGEFVYEVDLGYDAVIRVRSSVRADGWSAGNGEDSIRALITDRSGKPIGSAKSQRWVTRQTGWEDRLTGVLRTLAAAARKVRPCPTCRQKMIVVKVAQGQNKGKLAVTCPSKNAGKFLNHHFEICD